MSIRRHSCETLELFQAYGGGCRPSIGQSGEMGACDDSNILGLLMTNCPFCGEMLPPATLNKWQIEDLTEALAEARREVEES